jgi:hypothetical protein
MGIGFLALLATGSVICGNIDPILERQLDTFTLVPLSIDLDKRTWKNELEMSGYNSTSVEPRK